MRVGILRVHGTRDTGIGKNRGNPIFGINHGLSRPPNVDDSLLTYFNSHRSEMTEIEITKSKLNKLIKEAHYRHNNHMRADVKYLEMSISGECDKCGAELNNIDPTTLHPNYNYMKFLCDDCYQKRILNLSQGAK